MTTITRLPDPFVATIRADLDLYCETGAWLFGLHRTGQLSWFKRVILCAMLDNAMWPGETIEAIRRVRAVIESEVQHGETL